MTFPGALVTATELAVGGLSNTNIKVWCDHSAEPLRLRLFRRGADVAELEHAVMQRVAPDVPLPRCHCTSTDGPDGRPYAIYDWVDGERLENADLGLAARRDIGRDIGRILAAIHRTRFERTGYLNNHLEVSEPFDVSGAGLVRFARSVLESDRGRDRLGSDTALEFLAWLDRNAGSLDGPDANTAVLCHGDFGASNLIVSARAGHWRVVAVLDWEYACAGTPFGDLGNLLRPPLGTATGFEAAVIDSYRSAGGTLPANWKDLALLTDLFAWLEFLGREPLHESVIASARSRIAFTMDAVNIDA